MAKRETKIADNKTMIMVTPYIHVFKEAGDSRAPKYCRHIAKPVGPRSRDASFDEEKQERAPNLHEGLADPPLRYGSGAQLRFTYEVRAILFILLNFHNITNILTKIL